MKLIAVLAVACLLMVSCSNEPKVPNGWYFLNDEGTAVVGEAIITPKDFAQMRMDSFAISKPNEPYKMSYNILGKVNDEKLNDYKDATEKAIGKSLGFLYRDELVSTSKFNQKNKTGTFRISLEQDKEKAIKIYEDLKKQMQ